MDSALVDTNVLLRLLQPAHVHYPLASSAIAGLRQQNFDLCIVPQNLVEFWVVATRPLAGNGLGMSPLMIAGEIRGLRNLFRLLEGAAGIADAWEKLVTRHLVSGKQAHDAHLVAAMNIHGVRRLLTFNGDEFKRYEAIEVIVPASVSAR
jgi:predicted nucleic acid-binding protein